MKIFTTQLTELDLTAAEMLGNVIQIPVDLYRTNLTTTVKQDRVALIVATLDGENSYGHAFNAAEDAILCVGDPVNIGLVFHCAATRALDSGHSAITLLRFDRHRGYYVPVEVNL